MDEIEIVGQVIGGKIGDIIVREKSGKSLEIGELIVSEEENSFLILQAFALEYGSQIEERMQQMMSGVNFRTGSKGCRILRTRIRKLCSSTSQSFSACFKQ